MPCLCGNKVDRLDPLKVQCIMCNEFIHGSCYKIKESEIELIKVNFKCQACLSFRRRSLSENTSNAVSAATSASEMVATAGASKKVISSANAELPKPSALNNGKPVTASVSSNAVFVNKVQGAFEQM